MLENIRSDLARPRRQLGRRRGFWTLLVYRFGRWRYRVETPLLRKPFSLLYRIAFKWVQIVAGIELPCEVEIGRNFVIDHSGGHRRQRLRPIRRRLPDPHRRGRRPWPGSTTRARR